MPLYYLLQWRTITMPKHPKVLYEILLQFKNILPLETIPYNTTLCVIMDHFFFFAHFKNLRNIFLPTCLCSGIFLYAFFIIVSFSNT